MKGLVVPERTEDYTADQVELFFDLAYVFAYSQLVALLVAEPDWAGVGRASLVFLLLWLPWSQMTWAANAVPGNSRSTRLIFLAATAASVPMAASVTTAFDDGGLLLAVPLALITLSGLAMVVVAARGTPDAVAAARSYARPVLAAMVVIIVGGFFDDDARVVIWIGGVLIFGWSTIRAGGRDWTLRAGHFAERHGLIIIVALGEVIVAIGKPVVDSLEEGAGFPAESVVALTAAGIFATLWFWAYFDRPQRAFEHRVEAIATHAERAHLARDVYTYGHAPIVAGIIASAAALEEITLHPADPLPLAFRMMMLGGIALYVFGLSVGVRRSFGVIARERVVAVVVLAVVLVLGSDLDGVVLVVLIDLIVLAVLVVEHLRIEGRPPAQP